VKPVAAILFVGVAAAAFLLTWVFTENTDDRLVRLYQELAINRVKMTMRDSILCDSAGATVGINLPADAICP
jgi:hypothetical protein